MFGYILYSGYCFSFLIHSFPYYTRHIECILNIFNVNIIVAQTIIQNHNLYCDMSLYGGIMCIVVSREGTMSWFNKITSTNDNVLS